MRLLLKHQGYMYINKNCNAFIALRRFDSVVFSCFGIVRCTPGFHERILEFEEEYKCVIFIVYQKTYGMSQFCSLSGKFLPPDNGLAVVLEKALESSHHHFNIV